jgi:hypothetical protein
MKKEVVFCRCWEDECAFDWPAVEEEKVESIEYKE